MSTAQVVDRQWRALMQAACSGTWHEYDKASSRLASVDRLGIIKKHQLLAVEIIAKIRDGVTDQAVADCNELNATHSELLFSFVFPELRKSQENKSAEFVKYINSLSNTMKKKKTSKSSALGQVKYLSRLQLFANRNLPKVNGIAISVIIGIALVLLAFWYRYEEDSPVAFFENVSKASATNNPALVWDQLPDSLQLKADELVHDFAKIIHSASYDASWNIFRRILVLLDSKRSYIMNNPLVAIGLNKERKHQLEMAFEIILPTFKRIANSKITTTQGLETFSIGTFLDKYGEKIITSAIEIMNIADNHEIEMAIEMLQPPFFQATVVDQSNGYATVRISGFGPFTSFLITGENHDIAMIKMEGKWLPLNFVTEFQQSLIRAKREIINIELKMSDASQIEMAIIALMADTLLPPLEEANSQAEFDKALAELILRTNDFARNFNLSVE